MFGMGFTEILLIAVMAILFLGPDKLPSTMIQIAKFFKNVKDTIGTVKDSIEDEMNISEIKKEALAYKQELLNATQTINKVRDIPAEVTQQLNTMADDLLEDDNEETTPKAPKEPEKVTFKKKNKKIKKEEDSIDV
ncbi:Sec-independent protein translocase protein TatB [Sulfurimonas sp.]